MTTNRNAQTVTAEHEIFSTLEHHLQRLQQKRGAWASFRPSLFDLSPRWQWWSLVLMTKRLPPLPYPKIDFADSLADHALPMRMLRECLQPHDARFEDFIEWLLCCFGVPDVREVPKRASPSIIKHWESTFALKVMMDTPGDWLGAIYESDFVSKGTRDRSGFFTTPPSICRLLAEISLKDAKLTDSLNEPCCGSGRILLYASNYLLNLSGVDINPLLVKIATVNAWLYAPSIVIPVHELAITSTHTIDRKLINTFERSTYDQTRN